MNKKLLLIIILMLVVSSSIVSASRNNKPIKYDYVVPSDTGVICEDWPTYWIDIGNKYCVMNNTYIQCALCDPSFEKYFQDQKQSRECYNKYNPDDTWKEYRYRSVELGCCGICLE